MVESGGSRRLPWSFRPNIDINTRLSRPRPIFVKGLGRDSGGFNWLALIIILFLIIIGLNLYASGKLSEYWANVKVGWKETEMGDKMGLREIWNVITIQGFEKQEWDSYVVENEYLEEYGTHIITLYASGNILSGEDIFLIGRAETGKLNDYADYESNVECELEDFDGEVIVKPETLLEDRTENILCTFVDGIDTSITTHKEATLRVTYEFFSSGSWKAYFIDDEVYDDYKDRGINPLSELDDPYVRGDSVISKHTDGPVKVSINAEGSQPFIGELGLVRFHVQLTDNVAWKGRGSIKKVKELYLHVPEEKVELNKNVQLCDFEATGEFDENGYHIYTLTPAGMHKANRECGLFDGIRIGEEYCENDFIDLTCFFKVKEISSTWPDYENFLVDVKYIYETEASTAVTIEPLGGTKTDVCSFYEDEIQCLEAVGCEAVYVGEEFDSCRECDEKYCSQYDNQNRCESDPCNIGDCVFEDNECKSQDSLV